ncbi:hypothetical protein G9C85_11235 [Halorubellus sp. JP-L1]|uniref:hypothetical protein n=1 Tax=Halorubellus sp. JP-L1 TaxID=2715753 RepID=UPI0014075C94|nr:hypothetical protein [Halorubellus sp. JP-L1]NHN42195.1 hypothetical protein [Halorubellus sp. JP-L1]
MVTPLHLGLEHPSLLWIVLAGVVAFAAGLGVRMRRARRDDASPPDTAVVDAD